MTNPTREIMERLKRQDQERAQARQSRRRSSRPVEHKREKGALIYREHAYDLGEDLPGQMFYVEFYYRRFPPEERGTRSRNAFFTLPGIRVRLTGDQGQQMADGNVTHRNGQKYVIKDDAFMEGDGIVDVLGVGFGYPDLGFWNYVGEYLERARTNYASATVEQVQSAVNAYFTEMVKGLRRDYLSADALADLREELTGALGLPRMADLTSRYADLERIFGGGLPGSGKDR